MRISVELDDDDFVNVLVAILRQEGHRVVEPEVAEVRVMKCQSPREAIVLRYTSPVCDDRPLQIVAFLKSPVSVRQLASAVRRMVAA